MTVLQVAEVLDKDGLARAQAALGALTWKDGRNTAGALARQVKRNEQADLTSGKGLHLREQIEEAVRQNLVLKAAARIRRMTRPMVSRAADGGHYGLHVDNALMGKGEGRLRTDLSYTLFLSGPDTYDGGELVVHSASGQQALKLDAGDLVLYPSTELHEVRPVTAGERIVAVGWIESLVADPAQRALLFDLENLKASLGSSHEANSMELLTLDKAIANLLRMWARP